MAPNATPPDSTSALCIICNKPDSHSCSQCKSSFYCSRACQKKDWPTHKILCQSLSGLNPSSRPTKTHFRAILFPVDSKAPRLVWLPCGEDLVPGWFIGHHPEPDKYLDPDVTHGHETLQYNTVLKRELPGMITIRLHDEFLTDGSESNQSIARIMATTPGHKYDWRGPIIAYGTLEKGRPYNTCRDLDMNDFRHITDHFLSYNPSPIPSITRLIEIPLPYRTQPESQAISGVRINCMGDQKILEMPQYETFQVATSDSIFTYHDSSEIAHRIGLSIFTGQFRPDPRWENDFSNPKVPRSPFENQPATLLHLGLDPKAEWGVNGAQSTWGFASMRWQNSVGSVMVMRQDKKPLLPLHMEALCKYCQFEILPLPARRQPDDDSDDSYCEGEGEPLTADVILGMISRPNFEIYWQKFLETKTGTEKDTRSPYEA